MCEPLAASVTTVARPNVPSRAGGEEGVLGRERRKGGGGGSVGSGNSDTENRIGARCRAYEEKESEAGADTPAAAGARGKLVRSLGCMELIRSLG